MFDANNGIFFYADGTTLKIVRRTYVTGSAADTEKSQSEWNGDKLDGTGKSGYTLDPTKASILFMDFEWLGMGSVRVGFVIDGKFIVAHTFYNANDLSTVYMQTANLTNKI
jgi:alkyl hydroperoxide reductase subunit AhpC